MYKIRNVSNDNIIIEKNCLCPGKSMTISNINNISNIIKLGSIRIEKLKDDYMLDKNNFDKNELMESFFNYHFKNTSEKDINNMKTFYKKIGFSRNLNDEILSLLDNVNNQEDLTCVLLNSIYPALIDYYND